MTAILREAWNTSEHAEDRREKIQSLSLAKECYSMKLDLLTNATVVDDAIRSVSESGKSKDKDKDKEDQIKRSSFSSSDGGNEDDNKESKELIMMMRTKAQIKKEKKNRKNKLEK